MCAPGDLNVEQFSGFHRNIFTISTYTRGWVTHCMYSIELFQVQQDFGSVREMNEGRQILTVFIVPPTNLNKHLRFHLQTTGDSLIDI